MCIEEAYAISVSQKVSSVEYKQHARRKGAWRLHYYELGVYGMNIKDFIASLECIRNKLQ